MSGNDEAIRRLVRFLTVSTLIVAGVGAGVMFGVTSAGAQQEPIRVNIPAGVGKLIDLDHDGRIDLGDRVDGRSRLNDPATGDRMGRVLFECLATSQIVVEQQKGTGLCTYVLEFAEGDLTLQGEDPAGVSTHVFAVTGGTGLYRNARGEAEEVDTLVAEEITVHLEP